jgi:hypothetical protein
MSHPPTSSPIQLFISLQVEKEVEIWNLGFNSLNSILLQALGAINDIFFCAFELAFVVVAVGGNARDLDDAYDAEEEVYCCEPSFNEEN